MHNFILKVSVTPKKLFAHPQELLNAIITESLFESN